MATDRQPPSLAALTSVARLADDMDDAVTRLVAQARRDGRSWEAIGQALGITRQGAYARYAHRVAEAEDVPTP